MKKLLILLLILAPTMAQARIGETKEQCIERYGNPIKEVKERRICVFTKSGFRISVHFFVNRVDFIQYTKVDSNVITAEESRKLIAKNKENSRYELTTRPTANHLTISTQAYIDRFLKKEEDVVNADLLYL